MKKCSILDSDFRIFKILKLLPALLRTQKSPLSHVALAPAGSHGGEGWSLQPPAPTPKSEQLSQRSPEREKDKNTAFGFALESAFPLQVIVILSHVVLAIPSFPPSFHQTGV